MQEQNIRLFSKAINLLNELKESEFMQRESGYTRRDGPVLPIEVSAWHAAVDKNNFVGASAIDISKREENGKAFLEGNARQKSLFENSPIALIEEDFSEVKKYIDRLKEKGIADLKVHFDQRPSSMIKCSRLAKITDLNSAAARIFGRKEKEEMIGPVGPLLNGPGSLVNFSKEILSFASGCAEKSSCKYCDTRKLPSGELIHVMITSSIAPGCENRWEKVYISVMDVTRP